MFRRNFVIILIAFLQMFVFKTSFAQSLAYPHPDKKYDFIYYDSSFLYSPKGNPNLEIFFGKLDKFYFDGDEGFTVLHLGDSHTQAGVISWCLRRHFEDLCHNSYGDYGLMAPLSAAPKNNHPYYYVSSVSGNWQYERIIKNTTGTPIGLSGMLTYTTDSLANINFIFPKRAMKENHDVTKVKLLHSVTDTGYCISTNADSLLTDCYTDFTNGYTEFVYSQSLDSLSFNFTKIVDTLATMHVHGVLVEDSLPNVKFVTIGTNGASTESYVREKLLLKQLNQVNPDLAIVALGVNDASGKYFRQDKFEQNYRTIVNAVLEANPNCAIIFVSNNDFCNYRGGTNYNQPKVTDSMKKLAEHFSASLWDLYGIMGGCKSIYKWQKSGLARNDKIHFTNDGYFHIGDMLFGAILKEYEKHLIIKN